MKRKVMATREIPSRGGIARELTLACGHIIRRAGSWPVPVRADCHRCDMAPRPAFDPDLAA
jgi:hypothetical protein